MRVLNNRNGKGLLKRAPPLLLAKAGGAVRSLKPQMEVVNHRSSSAR
jgi:hypothetical protein